MKSAKATYYKAWLLMVVFIMNTVISSACSFSSALHQMHHAGNKSAAHHHNNTNKHKHHKDNHHTEKHNSQKSDCCSASVVLLQKADKWTSKTIEPSAAFWVVPFIAIYATLLFTAPAKVVFPQPVRWRLPATIQDLRIVIQSFQI